MYLMTMRSLVLLAKMKPREIEVVRSGDVARANTARTARILS
jgi:hypothetical protein